jgi:hypothetical protein
VSPYSTLATNQTPALVIYLLDVSASMAQSLGDRRRIDVVTDALMQVFRQMVFRSTRGGRLSPRYRIALIAYSDDVYDLLGGIRGIDEVAQMGAPELSPQRTTDTARAFAYAERLLEAELPRLQSCPAPLVCHMTDGEFTGEPPEPVVRRLMQMQVSDGHVLVENIFIAEQVLSESVPDVARWKGILPETPLQSEYARALRRMSSVIPENYRSMMRENQYQLSPGTVMLFPGTSPELVALGFQMSAATPVR